MKKICVLKGLFTDAQVKELSAISSDAQVIVTEPQDLEILAEANALIGNFPIPVIEKLNNLEWIQLNSSGADAFVKSAIPANVVITTATGAYGIGISEYMVAMLLNMMKKVPAYYENQQQGIWKDMGMVTTPMGKRVLILGTGNIGLEFAKRMRAFGCTLVGIRRKSGECPGELDEVYGMDALKEELAKADVIAMCLPGTADTYHLMDEAMLANCKEGAYLMNVGRGNVIPLDAFTKKETAERFAGIWLDVTEVEPLPDHHALFSVPNVLITPHITGGFHLDVTIQNIYDISTANMKAWMTGTPYKCVLNRESGYCS